MNKLDFEKARQMVVEKAKAQSIMNVTMSSPANSPLVGQRELEDPEKIYRLCKSACDDFLVCLNEVCDTYMTEARNKLRWFLPLDMLPEGFIELTEEEQTKVKAAIIKKKGLWNKRIKSDCNDSLDAIAATINHAKVRMKKKFKDYYYDYVDAYNEHIRNDVKTFYWAVRNALTKANYGAQYSDLYAIIETAGVLLGVSCKSFDELMADGEYRCGKSFRRRLIGYKPQQAFFYWQRMSQLVIDRKPKDLNANLNEDKDIMLAYEILLKRFKNGEFLDAAAYDCLEENYDNISEEKRKEFDEIKEKAKGGEI